MKDASKTAALPQYRSPVFMERFLDAIHEQGAPIERSVGERGAIKLVDGGEMVADALDYFAETKLAMEAEFVDELRNRIGKTKTELFCDVASKDWYDGMRRRQGERVLALKQSVRDYLEMIGQDRSMATMVVNDITNPCHGSFTPADITAILATNDQMLAHHIEEWKKRRSDSLQISDTDVFFRRGLSLKAPLDVKEPYHEWDFINSYSIALSAPEKFAQMQEGSVAALVNGDLGLFAGRVLFFSPFVPTMPVGQLEAGVIPSERPLPIKCQGEHARILEYILGERPEDIVEAD